MDDQVVQRRSQLWWECSEILDPIFRGMNVKSLRQARLVCRLWRDEAARFFSSKIKICLAPLQSVTTIHPFEDGTVVCSRVETEDVSPLHLKEKYLFLTKYRISYHLHLSIMSGFSRFCEFCTEIPRVLYFQRNDFINNKEFFCTISKQFLKPLATALVVTLKLQIAILSANDATIFTNTLSLTQNLRSLVISLVDFDERAIRHIPTNLSLVPGLKTFGLLINCEDDEDPRSLSVEAHIRFLNLFPNIECIGLRSWWFVPWNPRLVIGPSVYPLYFCYTDDIGTCASGIRQILFENGGALSKLKKVHLVFGYLPSNSNFSKRIFLPPVNLTHIKIFGFSGTKSVFQDLKAILHNYVSSLICFKLHFAAYTSETEANVLRLPVCPALTTLELVTTDSFAYQDCGRGWPISMVDIFGLRDIFLAGAQTVKHHLPVLHSLTIVLPHDNSVAMYRHIFPTVDKDWTPLRISQLKELTTSLTAECDRSIRAQMHTRVNAFDRLHKIFPEVTLLTHVRLETFDNFSYCQHEFDNDTEHRTVMTISDYHGFLLNDPDEFVPNIFNGIRELRKRGGREDDEELFLEVMSSTD